MPYQTEAIFRSSRNAINKLCLLCGYNPFSKYANPNFAFVRAASGFTLSAQALERKNQNKNTFFSYDNSFKKLITNEMISSWIKLTIPCFSYKPGVSHFE